MKIRSYKDLEIWQRSMGIVELIYNVTRDFPRSELYGLVSQLRRAAVAMPVNIAEGFGRKHVKEYRQFLYIAYASSCEVETLIIISVNTGFLPDKIGKEISLKLDEFQRMTKSLIKKL